MQSGGGSVVVRVCVVATIGSCILCQSRCINVGPQATYTGPGCSAQQRPVHLREENTENRRPSFSYIYILALLYIHN